MPITKLYFNGYEYRFFEQSDRTRALREQYRARGLHTETIYITWDDQPAILFEDCIYVQGKRAYDGVVDWRKRAPNRLRR